MTARERAVARQSAARQHHLDGLAAVTECPVTTLDDHHSHARWNRHAVAIVGEGLFAGMVVDQSPFAVA